MDQGNESDSRIRDFSLGLKGRINLVLAGTETGPEALLRLVLSSSLFSLRSARKGRDTTVARRTHHCRVVCLDRFAGRDEAGASRVPSQGYTIMLVRQPKGQDAFGFAGSGAFAILDTGLDTLPMVVEAVCRAAALGYVLDGAVTPYDKHFRLLCEHRIWTPQEWADRACLTVRRLEGICSLYSGLPLTFALKLYHALYFCTRMTCAPFGSRDLLDRHRATYLEAVDGVLKQAPRTAGRVFRFPGTDGREAAKSTQVVV